MYYATYYPRAFHSVSSASRLHFVNIIVFYFYTFVADPVVIVSVFHRCFGFYFIIITTYSFARSIFLYEMRKLELVVVVVVVVIGY